MMVPGKDKSWRELGAEKSGELGKELLLHGDPADTTLTVIWLALCSPAMHAPTVPASPTPSQSESKLKSVPSVQNEYVPDEASFTEAM